MNSILNSPGFLSLPDWYLWKFEQNKALFREMDRDTFHRSIFTDDRIQAKTRELYFIPSNELFNFISANSEAGNQSSIHFLFHVANCGSTLLARSLDIVNKTLVYREPSTLRQLGVDYVSVDTSDRANKNNGLHSVQKHIDLTLKLLSRKYEKTVP